MLKNLVGNHNWGIFKKAINDAHATFNKSEGLEWYHYTGTVDVFMEDVFREPGNYEVRELNGLLQGNQFQVWPITRATSTGEEDETNLVIWLNRSYLEEAGWVTPQGNLDIDPRYDYMVHHGIKYQIRGDGQMAQAYDDPLLIMVVLYRTQLTTGHPRDI